mmetsp:Transcript_13910/g.21018  ORF Transcript_13910/g.21018 Transcript_13910/m.21018 type:complete len:204 (-) Transcript_13910:131-742(-)|eukprot:CAMPEP_0167753686 /NCGR_PEP_ID=MMETSP0110_2-20121227/7856_1 /TAXON_ID=629695 /ORGANISM="Gymnochlora sp., Strain CCMP2014" /LENGTH=203 /DNA_ID=CAMNT_0007639489 /DNA_START=47 /DNA_END=658 /DNA_ORIENTATION=+
MADPELNFASAKFDPAKALSSTHVDLPVSQVEPRDNIVKCRELLPETDADHDSKADKKKENSKDKKSGLKKAYKGKKTVRDVIVKFNTEFQEPLPVACIADAFKKGMTVTEKISAWDESLLYGPLSVLKNIFNRRIKAFVRLRGARGIKASVTGYLQAFDKHCNLIMLDVEEEKFDAKRSTRHMKQLFIRGENVVIVSDTSPR